MTLCRNLPNYDGELPPGLPQDVVDDIVRSLISHSALNATTLRALRNCELRSLSLANCRLVTDEWLHSLSQQGSIPSDSPLSKHSSLASDDTVMEEVDIEAQNPSSEKFYGTFEELSQSSVSSFVSANEDFPMEDTRPMKECTPCAQSIACCVTSSLTMLDLRGSQHLTDRGLLQLTGLHCLEEVRLDNCHSLVGHGLLACSSSQALHTVSLSNCRRLTDTAVINISHLHSLQNLFLGGSRCLTDRSLAALAEMCELRRLDLSRCDLITDKGLESLEGLIVLEEVNIGWCRLISDAGLDCLTRQPHRDRNLRVLSIARCNITNDGMDHIGRLTALEELDMNGCNDVQSHALANTLRRLQNLTHLNASYCPNIL